MNKSSPGHTGLWVITALFLFLALVIAEPYVVSILNPRANLTNEQWPVEFTTSGQADISFSREGELLCGNVSSDASNYSCSNTSTFITLAEDGENTLEITFGNATATAEARLKSKSSEKSAAEEKKIEEKARDGALAGYGIAGYKEKKADYKIKRINEEEKKKVVETKALDKRLDPIVSYLVKDIDRDERIPVIVLLKDDAAGKSFERAKEIRMRAQQNKIDKLSDKEVNAKAKVGIINAFVGDVSADGLEELLDDPDVLYVDYDHIRTVSKEEGTTYEAKLTTSVPAIGANAVWAMGYNGSGVTIAVLDTGIDYDHPDLGGCFGAGCKVRDGYDFANDDADPDDDQGHGTHCAGIAAANGTIVGVAPEALIYAVKVLDSAGSGSDSDIIRGLDWSLANGADVLSLSLGGDTQPNDGVGALAFAMDSAVDYGAVVVIAAGNEGPGTGTTGDPAEAVKVISVGASNDHGTVTNSDDTVASFSNRGPSAFGRFDPEFVAPGSSITSTCMGGGSCTKSGTSMATPHVAGAAALLLDYDSTLTPMQIRSRLMQTAANITGHPFEKGAGLINLTDAFTNPLVAGIDGDQDRWEFKALPGTSDTAEICIENRGANAMAISFSVESITDVEGDNRLDKSAFDLPESENLSGGEDLCGTVRFSAPSDANASVYASTVIISSNTSLSLRLPIALTVPLLDQGMISGTIDDDYDALNGEWGDWIYYNLISSNGTSFNLTLNWTDSSDDLDLYVYAESGEEIAYSEAGATNYEVIEITPSVGNTYNYWAVVRAYSLSGGRIGYNLTVSYGGELGISPTKWSGSAQLGDASDASFTLKNDNTAKSSLDVSVDLLQDLGTLFIEDSVSASSNRRAWSAGTSALNVENGTHVDATLVWADPSMDLELCLAYEAWDGWYATNHCSQHKNNILGRGEEFFTADIEFLIKNWTDIGFYVINNNNTQVSFNLTLNFTGFAPWSEASVTPSSIAILGAGASEDINVSIATTYLDEGVTYKPFLRIWDGGEVLIRSPIALEILEPCFERQDGGVCDVPDDNCTCFRNALRDPNCTTIVLKEDFIDMPGTCVDDVSGLFDKTIDCDGKTIDGVGTGTAISLVSHESAAIMNCRISDFEYGINLTNSNSSVIYNNSLANISATSIMLSNTEQTDIVENVVENASQTSLTLMSSANNFVAFNTFENGSAYGLYVAGDSDSNEITNNSFNNHTAGVYLAATANQNNLSNNIVCLNLVSDINDSDSNGGDNNTCDWAIGWADDSVSAGCAQSCMPVSFVFEKTANVSQVYRGENITYTLFVNNTGTGLYSVEITDILNDTCLSLNFANPANTAENTWDLGNLAPGQVEYINISVQAIAPCLLNNTATINTSNANETNASVVVTIWETTEPGLTWTWQTNVQSKNNTVNVSLIGNENLSACTLNINGSNFSMDQHNATSYDYLWNVAADGNYTLRARCNDTVNNTGYTSSVWYKLDTQAPQIYWDQDSLNFTTVPNSVNLALNTSEAANCTLNISGVLYPNNAFATRTSWAVDNLSTGYVYYNATCLDVVGNSVTSVSMRGLKSCYNSTGAGVCIAPANCSCVTEALNDSTYCYSEVNMVSDIIMPEDDVCVVFEKGDTTLDCMDHFIVGQIGSKYGVYAEGVDNITIKNCQVARWSVDGIRIANSTNDAIYNNNISDNGPVLDSGLHLDNVNGSEIYSNNIFSNPSNGVSMIDCYGNDVYDNEIYDNSGHGIYLSSGGSNTIEDNRVYENAQNGLAMESSSTGNVIDNNVFCLNNQTMGNHYDVSDSDDNSGDENYCETFDGWNDTGTVGCTYSCAFVAVNKSTNMTEIDPYDAFNWTIVVENTGFYEVNVTLNDSNGMIFVAENLSSGASMVFSYTDNATCTNMTNAVGFNASTDSTEYVSSTSYMVGITSCGDGVCNCGETCNSCRTDCGRCDDDDDDSGSGRGSSGGSSFTTSGTIVSGSSILPSDGGSSGSDETETGPDSGEAEPDVEIIVQGSDQQVDGEQFTVVIVDENGNIVVGATVTYGDQTGVTGPDGKVTFTAEDGVTEIVARDKDGNVIATMKINPLSGKEDLPETSGTTTDQPTQKPKSDVSLDTTLFIMVAVLFVGLGAAVYFLKFR